MNKIIIMAIIALSFVTCKKEDEKLSVVKDYPEKCRELILHENIIGQEYLFVVNDTIVNEFKIIYLGYIVTKKQDTLRILSMTSYTGLYQDSKRGKGLLFIYDNKLNNLGFYDLGASWATPSTVKDNLIIFDYNNSFCNRKSFVDLADSIPNNIFINCTEKGGDIYTFSKQ